MRVPATPTTPWPLKPSLRDRPTPLSPVPAMSFVGKRPQDTVVVVTGATGRLGQRVCTELLSRGYQVRATDIKEDRRPPSAREEEVWGLPNTDYPVTVADM